jgi:hypothetical protein
MENITCVCEYCKRDFFVKYKCRKRRFCTKSCARSGENNSSWAGDNVGIVQVHTWMEKILGRPDRCSKCDKIGKVDLANRSNLYKRDVNDWDWLCRKCHMKSDGRLERFLSYSNMHNKIPNMKCHQCKKEFTPKSAKRKYCSNSCKTTFYNLNIMDYSKRKTKNDI